MSEQEPNVTDEDRAAARATFAAITLNGADVVGLERNIALAIAKARQSSTATPALQFRIDMAKENKREGRAGE